MGSFCSYEDNLVELETGQSITSANMQQNLVEHFSRWAKTVGHYGLLVLEVHSMAPEFVSKYLDEAENLHFDAYQAFSRQNLMEAHAFVRGAAEAGLFPIIATAKRYPQTLSFTRITLNHFEKRAYIIRCANIDDLDLLLILEQHCWPKPLRASRQQISKRILQYPDGQLVIEQSGRIIGVVYSQRINDIELIHRCNINQIESHHQDEGTILQLITLNILPEMQHQGLGDQLLEFILHCAALTNGIENIIGVTRCRDFVKQNTLKIENYITQRSENGFLTDPTLSFHEQHGAGIKSVVPGYRPTDMDNEGYGVLIEYPLRKKTEQT